VGNALERSHDKKVVVNEWITSNPAAAAALMPLNVASVLSKISFSLDHPEVANLVAAGIQQHGGSVSCSHIIVAAMKQCPFQDADIAKAMAPYVTDTENKDQVMQNKKTALTRVKSLSSSSRGFSFEQGCVPLVCQWMKASISQPCGC
jgi:hypothetical protein